MPKSSSSFESLEHLGVLEANSASRDSSQEKYDFWILQSISLDTQWVWLRY